MEDHSQEDHYSAEDLLVPSGATQTDMEEEQGYPHLWSTAAELQQTAGNKGYSARP